MPPRMGPALQELEKKLAARQAELMQANITVMQNMDAIAKLTTDRDQFAAQVETLEMNVRDASAAAVYAESVSEGCEGAPVAPAARFLLLDLISFSSAATCSPYSSSCPSACSLSASRPSLLSIRHLITLSSRSTLLVPVLWIDSEGNGWCRYSEQINQTNEELCAMQTTGSSALPS